MTINDLLLYYNNNKNECNEIRLFKKDTDDTVVFRHYIEYGTCADKWLNLDNEHIYKSAQIVENYDLIISPKNFNDIEHVKRIIKSRYTKSSSIILCTSFLGKDTMFSIYERKCYSTSEYYLISHFNNNVYTIDDIFNLGYKYYEEI